MEQPRKESIDTMEKYAAPGGVPLESPDDII